MTVFCKLCGREFATTTPSASGLAWCECCAGVVETQPRKPERHR